MRRPEPEGTGYRVLSPEGHFRFRAQGREFHPAADLFHLLMTMSWGRFLLVITGSYVIVNALFSLAYLAGGDCIKNARPGSFADAYFFSVQTLSTIGYGDMIPLTLYAHLVVAVEAFSGLLGLALAAGLMFAKFSRPRARVMFSRFACIAPRDGVPALTIRTANARPYGISDAQAKVILIRDDRTLEGEPVRRFYELALERPTTALFALTWTLSHRIEEGSPLHGYNAEEFLAARAEFFVVVSGIDETTGQPVHGRRSYVPTEIVVGQRHADILCRGADDAIEVDFNRFHELTSL